jgi:hypothetical protein
MPEAPLTDDNCVCGGWRYRGQDWKLEESPLVSLAGDRGWRCASHLTTFVRYHAHFAFDVYASLTYITISLRTATCILVCFDSIITHFPLQLVMTYETREYSFKDSAPCLQNMKPQTSYYYIQIFNTIWP